MGKDLGLPASPAIVIANIAKSHNRKGILVIDQLDAVSLASGRNPEFFDCILNIIEQAKQFNLHIVLACRKFDLDNDKRLNNLTGEESIVETVTIKSLTEKKVKEIVNSLGLDASRLNQKQIKLLSLPLHLGLLAETVKDSTIDTLNFETANDLFAQYWSSKQRNINQRLACPIQWTQVVDKLCDYMSRQQHQTLSAPESIVDEYFRDVEVMVSEHILVKENKRLRFFHESFFDYAFARRFAGREKDLLSFLKEDEQHLFKRAQVRQILVNERDENFEQYLDDLTELLNSDDIRFHIKQLVFALLSSFKQPTEKEWHIISPFIEDLQNTLYKTARSILFSTAWFKLLDSLGIIEQWLKDENEQRIEQTVSLLGVMQRELPEKLAELLEPFVGVSDVWDNHFIYLIKHTELHTNRRFFELFLQLIDKGILDEARDTVESNGDFWGLIYFPLFEKNPNWTCEVIGKYLNRRLDLYEKRLEENLSKLNINPFKSYYDENDLGTIEDTQHYDIFLESAKQSPQSFVTNVFPFMMRVIELTSDKNSEPPWKDGVWNHIAYDFNYRIDQTLLKATEIALSNLAKNNSEYFSEFIEKQQLCASNFETIQYLLIRAYKANGIRFADEAAEYICENPGRLKTNTLYTAGNGIIHAPPSSPYWATKDLLEVITPHLNKNLNKLEELILNYYPDREKDPKSRGYAQCVLLDAINRSRLSGKANRRLQELKRKFQLEKTEQIKPPESIEIEAVAVSSPISQNATAKMTDEQWLQAIKKYSYDDDAHIRFDQTGRLVGDARQLSSELEKQVKKNPVRFVQLIHKFPDETNKAYFDAVLRGIAESEVEINLSLEAVCDSLPNYQQQLQRGLNLGLIEMSPEVQEEERFYRVSRILPHIICSIQHPVAPEVYSLSRKAHDKLYELWGNEENKNEEKWREIFRLLFADKENPERFRQGFYQMFAVQYNLEANRALEFELRRLKNELPTDNSCRQLADYLSQKEWIKADKETTWIFYVVMVQQGYKDWLELCQNFPSEALKEIDQLWVNYSEGRFSDLDQRIWEIRKKQRSETANDWREYNYLLFSNWREAESELNLYTLIKKPWVLGGLLGGIWLESPDWGLDMRANLVNPLISSLAYRFNL